MMREAGEERETVRIRERITEYKDEDEFVE
jgi:hypothetical protein